MDMFVRDDSIIGVWGENVGISIIDCDDKGNVNRLLRVRRGREGCSSGSTCCSIGS